MKKKKEPKARNWLQVSTWKRGMKVEGSEDPPRVNNWLNRAEKDGDSVEDCHRLYHEEVVGYMKTIISMIGKKVSLVGYSSCYDSADFLIGNLKTIVYVYYSENTDEEPDSIIFVIADPDNEEWGSAFNKNRTVVIKCDQPFTEKMLNGFVEDLLSEFTSVKIAGVEADEDPIILN